MIRSVVLIALMACALTQTSLAQVALKKTTTPNILSCQLIEKNFVNKALRKTKHKELHLRCSIQDYFIKICESAVSEQDLRKHIDQGIRVRAQIIKKGLLDQCPKDSEQLQSRTGTYVVIQEIL